MKRRLAIGALVALALTSCTGGDGDDGGDGPVVTGGGSENGDDVGSGDVEPCELLTTEEVGAAVGNPVEDGEVDISLATCSWTSDPNATGASVAFLAFGVPRICADALAADSANEEIESFDDPAFWTFLPTAGGVGSISVCTAAGQLIVTVTGGLNDAADEARVRAATEDLTGKALARL
jgi:hypothetical protein